MQLASLSTFSSVSVVYNSFINLRTALLADLLLPVSQDTAKNVYSFSSPDRIWRNLG